MTKHKLTNQQQADIAWLLIVGIFCCYLAAKAVQLWTEYQQTLSWLKSF